MVFQVQLDQGCETEAETIGVSPGQRGAEELVEQESGFEVGAGGREFDVVDTVAKV
ncbi:MAG: hypothetical protein ACRD3L_13090 [Terriglobales bacterium]